MGKHLSDIDIDKVIKGKTSKVEFFQKWKEWLTCRECHADAYIRFYNYLTNTPAALIAADLAAPAVIVEIPIVQPVAQAAVPAVPAPPPFPPNIEAVPAPPPFPPYIPVVPVPPPAPVPLAAPPPVQLQPLFEPEIVAAPAPINEGALDLDLDIGQDDPPDPNE
jgi:hypothetical protein